MSRDPFWEHAYRDGNADPFGTASPEVAQLLTTLPTGACVLDVGCGAGRHALPLARAGMVVTAVDSSPSACARLRVLGRDMAHRLHIVQEDIRQFAFSKRYDVVIAHGVLHLLPELDRVEVLGRVQANTVAGGTNIIVVFTDRLPAAADLKAVTLGLFREGELFDAYRQWDIALAEAYTLHDEHPGGIRHEHAVNKIVARRPSGWSGAS